MSRKQAIKEANEKALQVLSQPRTSQGPHLGDLAFWSLEAGQNMSWPCQDVADCLRRHGLDPDTVLPEPTEYFTAFGRAVDSVRSAVRSLGYTLLDAAKGAKGERRVAIVRIERNGQVATQDEGTVTCPVDGTQPFVERHDPTSIAKQVRDKALSLYQVYTTADIRAGITTLFARWSAMPCRERPSVVYYLPPGGTGEIEAYSRAMQELGAGDISMFAGYTTDARSVHAVNSAVNRGLEDRLNEFTAEAQQYITSGKQERGIVTRLQRAHELRQQAALYRAILGAAIEAVDERVGQVEDCLKNALNDKTDKQEDVQ